MGFLNQHEGEDACLRRRASLGSDDGTKLFFFFFFFFTLEVEVEVDEAEKRRRRKKTDFFLHPLSHLIGSGARSTGVPRVLANRTPGSGEQNAASSCRFS